MNTNKLIMDDRIDFLKNVLLSINRNQISYDEAWTKLTSLPTPWETKEWKECRVNLINDKCEDCGRSDCVLVLQHTYQPQKSRHWKSQYYEKIKNIKWSSYFEKIYPNGIDHKSALEKIYLKLDNHPKENLCPKCLLRSFRARKTIKPKHICNNCKLEFEEPLYQNRFKNERVRKRQLGFEIMKYESKIFKAVDEAIQKDYKEEAEKFAIRNCIKESIEYCKFTHTKTSCKSCAFKEDIF